MSEKFTDWYILVDQGRGLGLDRGPFTTSQIRSFLETGEITEATLIRYGKDSHWQKIERVPILVAAIRDARTNRFKRKLWKNVRTGILLAVLIACAVFYVREKSPEGMPEFSNPIMGAQYPMRIQEPGNSSGYVSSPELLTGESIIRLTNNARLQNGLPPLKANMILDAVAKARAKDMLEKQYFAHVSPAGEEASDVAQRIGYHYKIIAENIAKGDFLTNQKLIDGWMQSPGHRMNILSSEVEEIGVAVLEGKMQGVDTHIIVQIFGLQSPPVSRHACVAPSRSLIEDVERGKAEMASLVDQYKRLEQELAADKETIETDRRFVDSDPKKIDSLNANISAYNQKGQWYNRLLTDAKAKSILLESMLNEYNRMVQAYNNCLSTK
jgi:uncharacterized protein YkwD